MVCSPLVLLQFVVVKTNKSAVVGEFSQKYSAESDFLRFWETFCKNDGKARANMKLHHSMFSHISSSLTCTVCVGVKLSLIEIVGIHAYVFDGQISEGRVLFFPCVKHHPLPLSQFRRCLLQLLCSRLTWLQCSLKERPLAPVQRPIRPIVMSRPCSSRNRPKKKVTFSSSSIVFIITSDDLHRLDVTSKSRDSTDVNVIQVRPLWAEWTGLSLPTTQYALGPNMQFQAKIILPDLPGHFCVHTQLQTWYQ